MRKPGYLFSGLFILTVLAIVLTLPIRADAKSSTAATTAPAPAATPTPAADATSTPAATTPAPAAKPAPVRAQIITVTDISTSGLSKGSIDVYMSLEDTAKLDDALVGAETPLSDKLDLVTIGAKDKKETVGNLRVELPSGKTVKLTADDKFVRISGIEKSLKDGDKFQLMLHFMRAPNVTVDVTVHKKSSWF